MLARSVKVIQPPRGALWLQPIAELQRQLDQLRSGRPRRSRLPESIWNSAVELARQHGIYAVAHALRLDYMGLKKRLGGASRRRRTAKAAFVELIAPSSTALPECVIEFESRSGAKMRIHWRAASAPDWSSLLRAWRETAG
jgi:hypothetical protein